MPPVIDSAGVVTATSFQPTTTVEHTCDGSDRLLLVFTARASGAVTGGVTYGGVALTLLDEVVGTGKCAIWYLKNPNSGTANVVVTWSVQGTSNIQAISYKDVNQTETFGTVLNKTYTSAGTAISDDVTSDIGDLVIDGGQSDANRVWTAGGSQTKTGDASSAPDLATSYATGQASSTTMSWTLSSATNRTHIGVALKPLVEVGGFLPVNFGGSGISIGTSGGWSVGNSN